MSTDIQYNPQKYVGFFSDKYDSNIQTAFKMSVSVMSVSKGSNKRGQG